MARWLDSWAALRADARAGDTWASAASLKVLPPSLKHVVIALRERMLDHASRRAASKDAHG
jgi:hypothetical protein